MRHIMGIVPAVLGGLLGLAIGFLFLRLMAALAGRLLGVRLSWWRILAAGYLGSTLGAAFAVAVGAQHMRNIGGGLIFFSSILAAMMLFNVVIELLGRPLGRDTVRRGHVGFPHPLRTTRRRLSRGSRYAQLMGIAARHGLGPYLGGWRASRREGTHAASAGRLWLQVRDALAEAGGAFVKLGQVLSTRPDMLPPAAIAALAGLQDRVPAAPAPAITALLAEELGAAPTTVFAWFDTKPLAAASIAQVYRARLTSGELVVVKVQRPGIRAGIERDLDIVLTRARALDARAGWARGVGALALAAGFAAALREELDFRVEARNMTAVTTGLQAADGWKGRVMVRAPCVFPHLSTAHVLVQEWLDGVSVREAGPLLDELKVERAELARALLRCVMWQILRNGVFHADPHPGNVLVLRDGHLALIDFGSVGRLDSMEREALMCMLLAVDRRDAAMLHDALRGITQRPATLDEERLERTLAYFMARRLGPGMPVGPEMFRDLFALLFEFGLAVSPAVGAVFRTLVTLQGTLELIDPHFQMVDEARRMAADWARGATSPQSLRKTATDELLAVLPMLRRMPRRLDRITAGLERGTLSVNIRLFADERDAILVGYWVGRIVLACLGAALGLISVLLLGLKGGPMLNATLGMYQAFGYAGLFISITLILRVVVAIARDGVG